VVALDRSGSLQALNPFGNSRRGEADPASELGDGYPPIDLQLTEYA
jgi:hypothetical protein